MVSCLKPCQDGAAVFHPACDLDTADFPVPPVQDPQARSALAAARAGPSRGRDRHFAVYGGLTLPTGDANEAGKALFWPEKPARMTAGRVFVRMVIGLLPR